MIFKKKLKISQAVLSITLFTIVASVALGQNYTQSLIQEANDGIGISNFLATVLLPESHWTREIFLSRFELFLGISIAFIVIYIVTVVIEKGD